MARGYDNTPEMIWQSGVRTSTGCLEWSGYVRRGIRGLPYGALKIGGRHRAVHRIAWELYSGPIPAGAFICHHCDNPRCFEPSHLYLGDAASNMADKVARGRSNGWPKGKKRVWARPNASRDALGRFIAND